MFLRNYFFSIFLLPLPFFFLFFLKTSLRGKVIVIIRISCTEALNLVAHQLVGIFKCFFCSFIWYLLLVAQTPSIKFGNNILPLCAYIRASFKRQLNAISTLMTWEYSALSSSLDAEVEAWMSVCQSALLSTVQRAVENAEEPESRAVIISSQVEEWKQLMENYISASSTLVCLQHETKYRRDSFSRVDGDDGKAPRGETTERERNEELYRVQWEEDKESLETQIQLHRKEIERLQKVEGAMREKIREQEELLMELEKCIAERREAISKEMEEAFVCTSGKENDEIGRALKNLQNLRQESPGMSTPDSKVESSHNTLGEGQQIECKEGDKGVATSFSLPPPTGLVEIRSEDQMEWDDSSMYNDEEKEVILHNDIENNKELLRVLETKVSEIKGECDQVTASYNVRKKELCEIEQTLANKQEALMQVKESIQEKETKLLRLQHCTPSEEKTSLEDIKLSDKKALLLQAEEEVMKKQQSLLWITAEMQKKEEIVEVYTEKIAALRQYVQTFQTLMSEKERHIEYLEKCRAIQEETFEQVCQEIQVKSKKIHDLQVEIDHLALTLSEIEEAVSSQESQLSELLVSEKLLREKLHSEEQRKAEVTEMCERMTSEKERLQETLEKLRSQERDQQDTLLKLLKTNDAVLNQQKICEKRWENEIALAEKRSRSRSITKEGKDPEDMHSFALSKAPPPLLVTPSSPSESPHLMAGDYDVRSSLLEPSAKVGSSKLVSEKNTSNAVRKDNSTREMREPMTRVDAQNDEAFQVDQIAIEGGRISETGERSAYLPLSPYDLYREEAPFFSPPFHEGPLPEGVEGHPSRCVDPVMSSLRSIQEHAQQLREASSSEMGKSQTPKSMNISRWKFLPSHLRVYVHSQQRTLEGNRTPWHRLAQSSPSQSYRREGQWVGPSMTGITDNTSVPLFPNDRVEHRREKGQTSSHGTYSFSQAQSTPLVHRPASSIDVHKNGDIDSAGAYLRSNLFPKSPPPCTPKVEANERKKGEGEVEDESGRTNTFFRDPRDSIPMSFPSTSFSISGSPGLEGLPLVPHSGTLRSSSLDFNSTSEGAAGKLMEELRRMRKLANVTQISGMAKKNLSNEAQ